jgi:hypothetical protein
MMLMFGLMIALSPTGASAGSGGASNANGWDYINVTDYTSSQCGYTRVNLQVDPSRTAGYIGYTVNWRNATTGRTGSFSNRDMVWDGGFHSYIHHFYTGRGNVSVSVQPHYDSAYWGGNYSLPYLSQSTWVSAC